MSLTIEPQAQQAAPQETQQVETQGTPQLGTPEYDQLMAQKGQAHQTQFEDQRPEWLPEKFWGDGKPNYEALAKSYAELESKIGSRGQQPQQVQAPTETQQAQPQVQPAVPTQADFDKYANEFRTQGGLSDATYQELAQKGYSREFVDTYIDGQQARATRDRNELVSGVGGEDAFKQLSSWAAVNLSAQELAGFNQQVTVSKDSAAIALQWLKGKYESANGVRPQLLSGDGSPTYQGGFRSQDEVIRAMRDPRYKTDEAYRQGVYDRLSRKTF